MTTSYKEFIQSKIKRVESSGFACGKLNPSLFNFQADIVRRALKAGRYAIFAECGLGKTLMQLEWATNVARYTNRPVLILCPLAVAGQTIEEGNKFGIDVARMGVNRVTSGVWITNYEQLHNIDVSCFSGVVLDESSILKNFSGRTKQGLVTAFANTPYKLCCTATPSPNDETEITNHAEFLNVASRLEVLSRFFINDTANTGTWRLKKHSRRDFYAWMGSWATMIGNPSDIGYDGDGYVLPELRYFEHNLESDKRDNGKLFNDTAVNASNFNAELRATKQERVSIACDLANSNNEQWIVWCNLNDESSDLARGIDGAIEVTGSMAPEKKEEALIGFAHGKYRVLVTKKEIAQFGLNFQNCHNQVFASMDFSFEGLYQAIRRSYRFGQTKEVNVHLITVDTMQNVIESIKVKEQKFKTMQQEMNAAVYENTPDEYLAKAENVITDQYQLYHGDCVETLKSLPSGSADMMIFSPPFAELYVYSNSPNDMGNVADYREFEKHFSYLIPELARTLKSGRICAVHCMDLPLAKWKDGVIGRRDFSGMLVRMFEEHGFIYHCRITIWKDPVVEMQRTKALGLLHKQLRKDSSMSRTGNPDYLLIFRNAGDNEVPITQTLSVDTWQEWASPVWMDIQQTNTLQKDSAREADDEKHICPLQLDVIKRAVLLWSNPNDVVLSPFGGIGSEGYEAIKCGRRFIGVELKRSYYEQMKKNIKSASLLKGQDVLFAV